MVLVSITDLCTQEIFENSKMCFSSIRALSAVGAVNSLQDFCVRVATASTGIFSQMSESLFPPLGCHDKASAAYCLLPPL